MIFVELQFLGEEETISNKLYFETEADMLQFMDNLDNFSKVKFEYNWNTVEYVQEDEM